MKLESAKAEAGKPVKGVVTVTFASGFHAYQNPPTKDYMIPLKVAGAAGTKLLKASYPAGITVKVSSEPEPIQVYEGSVQIPVTLVAPAKPGAQKLALTVSYQQCNETQCFRPREQSVEATVTVKQAEAPVAAPVKPQPPEVAQPQQAPPVQPEPAPTAVPAQQTVPQGPTPSVAPQPAPTAQTPPEPPVAQPKTTQDGGAVADFLNDGFKNRNYGLVFLAALLTGLLLCLTPCVFPMIPITVTFFGNQTGGSTAARFGLGAAYTAGIAVTYGVVGGVVAALGGSVGALFTKPWFLMVLAAIMFGLGLSMFDVYEIGVPRFIAKQLKSRAGVVGALVMGLLMGFAAAPCAGALVIGAATKVAEIGSVGFGILVFTSIGLGLGLPFMALAALSAGAKAWPKSGGWLGTVKALLGIVVFWLGFDYLLKGLGMRIGDPNTLLAWILAYLVAAAYLLFVEHSGQTRAIFVIKGVAVLALGLLAGSALSQRNQALFEQQLAHSGGTTARVVWTKYTPEAFEQAKRSGKPILIDASADWCVKCQEIKHDVLEKPEAVAALRGVETLVIDHSTGVDQAYIDSTSKQFGIKGLPQVMFFKPGGEPSATVYELKSVDGLKSLLKKAGASL